MTRTGSHYRSLVTLLSNILEAHTVAFFIAFPKKHELRLIAAQSLSKNLREHSVISFEDGGLLAQVMRTGQTIHLDKLGSQDIDAALPFYREGVSLIKAVFITPVGDGAGVLFVDTKYSWGFNDKQRKWITEVAALLNELLEHHQTLIREQKYARILSLLHRIDDAAFSDIVPERFLRTLVNECTRFLEMDFGFLIGAGPGNDDYQVLAASGNADDAFRNRTFSKHQGLAGWALLKQKNLKIRRLRREAKEHYLFFPQEKLPHQGTFMAFHSHIPLGQPMALVFLSRLLRECHVDEQYAVEKATRFVSLYLERANLGNTCDRLRTFDATTNLCNPPTFETLLEQQISESVSQSRPFAMAILQFEPWETLHLEWRPQQVRAFRQELIQRIHQFLPEEIIAGNLADNRLAILFKRSNMQEAETVLARLTASWRKGSLELARNLQLELRHSLVACPMDGNNTEALWSLGYRRLYGEPLDHDGGVAAK